MLKADGQLVGTPSRTVVAANNALAAAASSVVQTGLCPCRRDFGSVICHLDPP